VAGALKNVFGLSGNAAASTLKNASYGANEIAKSIKGVYGMSAESLGKALKSADFGTGAIKDALGSLFSFSVLKWIEIFKDIF
jgi:hypothetical protein